MAKKKLEKKLTESELHTFDKASCDCKMASLEILLIKERLKVNKLEADLMLIEIQKTNDRLASIKNKQKTFVGEISSRFKLKGAWGYDPGTGIIKE